MGTIVSAIWAVRTMSLISTSITRDGWCFKIWTVTTISTMTNIMTTGTNGCRVNSFYVIRTNPTVKPMTLISTTTAGARSLTVIRTKSTRGTTVCC